MNVLFLWPGLTGYMGDAWRALATRVRLKVLVDGCGLGVNFDERTLDGLDWERVTADDVVAKIAAFSPDALAVVGWRRPLARLVACSPALATVPKLLVMDMPWRRSLRCFAARFALRRYVRRFVGALVHGESSARYARWLGFPDAAVHRHSIFGLDLTRFEVGGSSRPRRGFLFVGRHVPEKGLDTLRAADGLYRRQGGTWPLDVPDWIDPADVPRAMRAHACLVLPSRWEPWGVVVAEAKAAGMKVVVSDRVGARLDLPCDGVFPAGDAAALAERMLAVERSGLSPDESRQAAAAVRPWSRDAWADRIVTIVADVSSGGGASG